MVVYNFPWLSEGSLQTNITAMTANSRSFTLQDQPEVFFSSAETSRAVNYAIETGRARRIARGVITRNMNDPIEVVVRRNCWRIAGYYFPGAVVVDRTAVEMVPASDGTVTLAAATPREVKLPGLWLRAREGPGPLDDDARWQGEDLFMSSRPRAFLENFRPSRSRVGVSRTLGQEELEEKLDAYAGRDLTNLNRLRDAARELAPKIGADAELQVLDDLIGALHGTRPSTKLKSSLGRSRASGLPYDQGRLVRFDQLARHLLEIAPPHLGENPAHELTTFAFFESYFSNFIEGTEFTLDEAERIVFKGEMPEQRPQDAHDILGTYHLVVDARERGRVPKSADELIEILRDQHAQMLAERPEIGPGEWKNGSNRAGGTHFVAPEFVEGTLLQSWRFYESLPAGFARAAFAMFAVSEVHPFADGNGRTARLLMNSELTAAGEQRIIVPSSRRVDYLGGLRGMTHNARAASFIAVLAALQAQSGEVNYSSRPAAELDLHRRRAFDDPSEQPGFVDALAEGAQKP